MSSKKAAREHEADPPDADALLRLQRDLADRERQLRDLTEQSLGFLEELAEARRLNGDRERLAERIGELERQLTDARHRLVHAGGRAASAGGDDRKTKGGGKKGGAAKGSGKNGRDARAPRLAVVFWGEGSLDRALAHRDVCGDVPVAWVGPPAAVPADLADDALTTIVHRDAGTPAQCWNLALAGTDADAVCLIGPGLELDAAPALPDGLGANVALLAPRIAHGDAASIGCAEADSLLRLVPRPAPDPADGAPFPVPWAAPAAFVVRRGVYEQVGAFDEGLLGGASLLDWTLRARRANFEVVGTTATTLRGDGGVGDEDPHDRERLFVIAQHRPDQVARALADLDELWQLAPNDLASYLAAILARLPAGDLAAQRALFDRISTGLVRNSLPSSQVCALVQSSRVALLRSCIDAGLLQADELEAALHRAETQPVSPAAAAFEALGRDIALCRAAAAATARTLEQTRGERREIDGQRHAQAARAERAEGARATTAQQLEQVQKWLREANDELKRVQERRQVAEREIAEAKESVRQRGEQLQELRQQSDAARQQGEKLQRDNERLQRDNERLQRERDALAAELEDLRARVGKSEQRLAAQQQSHRELEREFLAADAELRGMHEHTAELARIVGFAAGVDRAGLRGRLEFLQHEADKFARTLREAGADDERQLLANVGRLAKQLEESDKTLREREQWIALLLREVASRRLFPRQLLDHEREFLDRAGKPS